MQADNFIKSIAISKMMIHGLFWPGGMLRESESLWGAISFANILLRTTRTRKFINYTRSLQCGNWVLVGTELRKFGGVITYHKFNLFAK